mmetsp:Transcript_132333/g.411353  ORF Transcript_132333/g.411353 Transcript_132333/m.411353 type:complete len:108 (-) Transcript_132333:62-385(-)
MPPAAEADEEEEARPVQQEESARPAPDPSQRILQSEWLNDLMTGFAVIWKSTESAGRDCGDCVSRTAYPIKERILGTVDSVQSRTNPSAETRTGRGEFTVTPTFSHE